MVKKEPTVPPTSMTTSKTAEVKTILGTMTFGWSYSSEDMAENGERKVVGVFHRRKWNIVVVVIFVVFD